MKKTITGFLFLVVCQAVMFPSEVLRSPDNHTIVTVSLEDRLSFSVTFHDEVVLKNIDINLLFNGQSLFTPGRHRVVRNTVAYSVIPQIPYKNSRIPVEYHSMLIRLNRKFSVEFRAFNQGVAYRFVTDIPEQVEVNETMECEFGDDYKLWTSLIEGFQSSYESTFEPLTVSEFPEEKNSYLPLLAETNRRYKILITEADLYDYPNMFLQKGAKKNVLQAVMPPYPLETEGVGDRGSRITKAAEYIALTTGERNFPWRLFILAENDARLIETELVYVLSREAEKADYSWIQPGRVAWDWWNASNLYGVDFKAGLNTDTWKYYVDFASAYGLEYIILDEGWSFSTTDISRPNPDLDLDHLIGYAKSKNVGIILWTTWRALNEQMDVLDLYREWGIAGIKVDFMNRSDQWMVNFYEKVAEEAFRRELLVDFHGAYKPVGLRRKYPNVLTYEGVYGLENCKWSEMVTPEHNLTIPFIRMACGPMDYTPGAMRNYHSGKFTPIFDRPVSMGTRCHQLALFILYESGLQMFADSPSNYYREEETTGFLAKIPVVWNETRVLEARLGEYLVIARRNGDTWYIGGITNGESRSFDIDLSFLGSGNYRATLMTDGTNADRFAEDYRKTIRTVTNHTNLKIQMAAEGGMAVMIEPQ
ncbi:MAG: glycoside hydrolase family 97 protein [Bacteroidales bacterium]